MSKQQNDLFKQQDVEEAKKILTSVQDQDIEAVYKIVGLPSRIQQKLNDQSIKANAVYKIVGRILQKFNAKTSDTEKILTKELSDLKTSCATDEAEINTTEANTPKLYTLCTKLATEKEELEQVQKCLNLIHAIKNTNVSIKQILNMSDVSYRIIEKLHLDEDTPISKVVEQLENLLPTFNNPVSESDSDYTSSYDDLSRSTSETQHTVKFLNYILTNNPQHEVLLKIKEAANKFTLGHSNTEHHINNNDDVIVAGGHVEHNDTH